MVDSFPGAERILRRRFSTTGKLIATPWDILPSCSAKNLLVFHNSLRCTSFYSQFATLQWVWLGEWVCWFVCSTKSSFESIFTLALQCPFYLKMHSQGKKSFAKFFWSIHKYQSLISFRCPRSVAINLISNAVLFEWNEINAVLFKLYEMIVSLNLTYAIPFLMYLCLWFHLSCNIFKLFVQVVKAIHWSKNVLPFISYLSNKRRI